MIKDKKKEVSSQNYFVNKIGCQTHYSVLGSHRMKKKLQKLSALYARVPFLYEQQAAVSSIGEQWVTRSTQLLSESAIMSLNRIFAWPKLFLKSITFTKPAILGYFGYERRNGKN